MWEFLTKLIGGSAPAQAAPGQVAPAATGSWLGSLLGGLISPFTLLLGGGLYGSWRAGWMDGFLPASWKSTATDWKFGALPDPAIERAIGSAPGLMDPEKAELRAIYGKLQDAGKIEVVRAQLVALGTHFNAAGDQLTGGDKARTAQLLRDIATTLTSAGGTPDDKTAAAIQHLTRRAGEISPVAGGR